MMEILLWLIVWFIVGLMIYLNKYESAEIPYPDECWDCNKGTCKGCIINKGGD